MNVQLSCSPRATGDRWHDGLICSCIICKAQPCLELIGMIGADLVPIANVSSSHQLDRSLHEVVTVGMLGHRQRCGDAACSA